MVRKDLQINARKALILDWLTKTRIDVASAELLLILKGSSAQPKIPVQSMPQVWPLHKLLLPKKHNTSNPITSTGNQLCIN